jgi:uncharacterized RDD family membrane protein YckC
MPRPEQFQRVEDEYFRLKGKYATGRLSEEEFDQALKDLMFQDSQGRYWMVGADTGEWYASDGGAWVKAQPPAAATVAPRASPPVAPVELESKSAPLAAEAGATAPRRYGGFWRRLIAYLLDGILLGVLNFFVLEPLTGAIVRSPALAPLTYNLLNPMIDWMGSTVNATATTTLGMVLSVLLAGLYFVAFWTFVGRTPGMLLLGMKIVTGDGRRPGFVRSLIRYIGYFVSAILFCLGFIWIGIDARKQGWHDKLAGTFVART